MKRAAVIASILISFFGLTARIHAAPQESSTGIKQKVSKTARKAAAQATVRYEGSPQFAWIERTLIAYATNTSQVVLRVGDTFYFNFSFFNPTLRTEQSVWLASASAQGPWTPAYTIPIEVTSIACVQINSESLGPSQLCALPWSS
ncbi:MAG: hypothetical protein WAL95_13605 [Candidatus Acidiferrales bacterium]